MASNTRIKRIYIEITNCCNLNCSFCVPTKRKPRQMRVDEFELILKQVKPITSYIYLHVKGEPTIHPDFDQILSLCDSYQMNVQLVTNGTQLSAIKPNHPSLRKLSISAHSLDQHNFDFDSLTRQIHHLIDHQQDYCQFLEIRFWLQDQLQERSKKLANDLMTSYTPIPCASHHNYKIKANCYIGFESSFNWPKINEHKCTQGSCLGGVTMLAILVDGSVTLCCLDNDGDLTIGNIFQQSLNSIMNNPRYLNYLNAISKRQLIEPLCQCCTYRQRFK